MLSEKEKNIILQILSPYNPKKIGVFGSRARNEFSEESDLDLLVDLENVNLFDLVELEFALSRHLGMKVDLVTEGSLNKYIRPNVQKEIYYLLKEDKELQDEKWSSLSPHIIDSIDQIFEYTDQLSFLEFKESRLVQDAVVRNFEIIGEATKQVSTETREEFEEIKWKSMSGMRDILIHNYMGVDLNVVWKTIDALPQLRKNLNQVLARMTD